MPLFFRILAFPALMLLALSGQVAPHVDGVELLAPDVKFNTPASFRVSLSDTNGAQHVETLELRIGTSLMRPLCMASVDFRRQLVEVYGFDNATPVASFPLSAPADVLGSFCEFGLLDWDEDRFNSKLPDFRMRFRMKPLPISHFVQSIAAAFYLRVRDADGNTSGWQRFTPFSVGEECIVRTAGWRMVLDQLARDVNWRVTAPASCMWSAYSSTDNAVIDPEWKVGTQSLIVNVPAAAELTFLDELEIGTRAKQVVRLPAIAAAPIVPTENSIVHGARFLPPVAGGSWFSIFGMNLALQAYDWQESDLHDDRLPLGLDGIEVLVNDLPIPLSFVGPGQINALMPGKYGEGLVRLRIRTPFGESAQYLVPVGLFVPGLFYNEREGMKLAAARHADGAAVGPLEIVDGVVISRPAEVGEVVEVYGTGFGPTNPPVDDDVLFQGAATLIDELPASVTIGGKATAIEFIGKSATGLCQMNVKVPALPPGNHTIILKVATVSSQADVRIPVEP